MKHFIVTVTAAQIEAETAQDAANWMAKSLSKIGPDCYKLDMEVAELTPRMNVRRKTIQYLRPQRGRVER